MRLTRSLGPFREETVFRILSPQSTLAFVPSWYDGPTCSATIQLLSDWCKAASRAVILSLGGGGRGGVESDASLPATAHEERFNLQARCVSNNTTRDEAWTKYVHPSSIIIFIPWYFITKTSGTMGQRESRRETVGTVVKHDRV